MISRKRIAPLGLILWVLLLAALALAAAANGQIAIAARMSLLAAVTAVAAYLSWRMTA